MKMLKYASLFLLVFVSVKGISQTLVSFNFNGTASCVNGSQGNVNTTNLTNATVTPFSRTSDLACYATQDNFGSSGWSSATAVNYNQYIEVMVTASAGYQLNLYSANFNISRLSSGPVNARIANNAYGDFSNSYSDFSVPTSSTPISWTFTSFSTGFGGTVKFRIYGWNASNSTPSSNVMKLWGFSLNGTVTPLVIATNSTLGLVKIGSGLNVDNNGLLKSPSATATSLGSVKVGKGLVIDTSGVLNTPQSISTSATPTFAGQTLTGALNGTTGSFSKIAIGTNTPDTSFSLAVNGTIGTKKVKVTQLGWADYVFDKTYKLPSLQSVEQYIAQNNHLPDVPSAATVAKEGIDLGDNQAVLLKKIEELTLYMIELQKKNESLQKKDEDLQKQIDDLKSKKKM